MWSHTLVCGHHNKLIGSSSDSYIAAANAPLKHITATMHGEALFVNTRFLFASYWCMHAIRRFTKTRQSKFIWHIVVKTNALYCINLIWHWQSLWHPYRMLRFHHKEIEWRFSACLTMLERAIAICLSICLSVCHTRDSRLGGSRYRNAFRTTR